ncbi:MAG: hypothetical protein SFV18_19600 [Bryobacteraceae bacterium]|nr:hypothetical protein [Bryobacteraceae bacterium]
MPKLARWDDFPAAVRTHLIQRMREREISIADLAKLRNWAALNPELPDGPWFKDFGTFKICGQGALPKTFLLKGQIATGVEL